MNDKIVARALGITGMAIGIAELVVPNLVNKTLGVANRPLLTRAMGAREIASGVGILASPARSLGLWSRVGGDVVDVALLGLAAWKGVRRKSTLGILAAVVAIGALDFLFARRLHSQVPSHVS